jgi:hypothetical protein
MLKRRYDCAFSKSSPAFSVAGLDLEKAQSYLLLSILFHGRKAPECAKKCIGLAIERFQWQPKDRLTTRGFGQVKDDATQ